MSGSERALVQPISDDPRGQIVATTGRRIFAGGLEWHVEEAGSGPVMLLLHGTGSTAHSWRDLAPWLAAQFRVVVPDLPGHGRTSSPEFAGFALPAMAAALADLLSAIDAPPALVVGHSAGAAILVRMALDGRICPRALISVNGALLPFNGIARFLFAPLARLLARNSVVPRWVASRAADPVAVERLIADTGSRLDATGIELYGQWARCPRHVSAALSMMANWDLQTLVADLPRLEVPLKLLVASGDRTIPPSQAQAVRTLLPSARIIALGDLGHLAHEERPLKVSDIIFRVAREAGVLRQESSR